MEKQKYIIIWFGGQKPSREFFFTEFKVKEVEKYEILLNKKESVERNFEMISILKLSNKDVKTTFIDMLKYIQE